MFIERTEESQVSCLSLIYVCHILNYSKCVCDSSQVEHVESHIYITPQFNDNDRSL